MAKAWSSWFPDVMIHVAGCPDIVIEHALLRASQDLFEEVRAWRVALDPITTDSPDVDVVPDDSGTEITRTELARVNGVAITICDEAEIVERFGGDWETKTGTPSAAVCFSPGAIRLVPAPTDAVSLALTVSVRPSDSATGVPDDVYRFARDAITSGALSRLFGIKKGVWADEGQALKYFTLFEQAKDSLAVRAAKRFSAGRISSSVRWC